MITPSRRRRARRRPLLYGTVAVLCGATIVLTTLSLVGYVRYQQVAAEAHTATARAHEAETFTSEMGLLTADGRLLLECTLSCVIALKPSTDITGEAARSKYLHLVSKSGRKCRIPLGLFETPAISPDSSMLYIFRLDNLTDCAGLNILTATGTAVPDGQTRTAAAISGIDQVDHVDFLDDADKPIFSVQISPDARGQFHLTAPQTADGATQAARNAMRRLVTTSGGAFLAFFGIGVLGWMAARGRFAPRRALQRREKTGGEIGQQSSCGKAWADKVTMGLIASAVRALDHPDDQDRYREEWAADSDEIPGTWQRLRWALLLRLFAPMGIRSTRRDALSMSPPQQ